MSKDRLEAFSDGVFAIILTLLVLELRVPVIPEHSTLSQYMLAITPLIPKFVSFVLSFLIVAIHWVSHHYFFRHLRKTPLGMVWLNNLFLLWVCFMPFPTALLGDHPTDQFPIILYAINQLLAALTFFAFRSYATSKKLFVDHVSIGAMGPRRSMPAIIIFTLSIVFAFVNSYMSLACFLIVPILYFLPGIIGAKADEDFDH